MRIVFVLAGLGAGGAERVVALLCRHLVSRGHEVSVVAFDQPEDAIYHQFPSDIRIVRLGVAKGGGRLLRGAGQSALRLLRLRKYLKAQKPDVVVSFLTKINVLTLLAAKGLQLKVVISERNNPDAQRANPLWSRLWNRLAPSAAYIVLQTEAIRRIYPPEIADRAVVIPNPVFVPDRLHSDGEPRVIAGVGRLTEQKGFDRLIAAFAQIAADFPDWKLIIWGEGPLRQHLEAQARNTPYGHRISFPGVSDCPGGWIKGSRIFALSSRYEGFPNVLLEAMHGGLAVAAFDCPYGPGDIVHHDRDGLLVPEGDIEGLARSLSLLMKSRRLCQNLSECAKEKAVTLSAESVVPKWEALIDPLYKFHK